MYTCTYIVHTVVRKFFAVYDFLYSPKTTKIKHVKFFQHVYHIRPNFRATQFSQITISKHFAETIFVDQKFQVYCILKFRELVFWGLLGSAKNAQITCLENLDVYGI